jgi:ubiquitin-small subunit ribosomal protein S27Ae
MADKKEKGKKNTSEKWKKYIVKGDTIERTAKFCPRCGAGIFLAESKSKDRRYCGKCHYTEFTR